MNTKAVDTELEFELQDLYISSKNWLSDLSFANDEIRLFKDMINKYLIQITDGEPQARLNGCLDTLAQQHESMISLKIQVTLYLNYLGTLITGREKEIGMELIEKHSLLENNITILVNSVKAIRNKLFLLNHNVANTTNALFV